ncbi:MAG: hypothetical protein Q7J80_08695 [Anaerolineales bacterium]|nr:hypothetical protein [Anaerolineales bacterium]
MNNTLYRFVTWGFQELIWRGKLTGFQNLPSAGPAVFVANHCAALGPIAVGGCVPLTLHAWIHGDMLDPLRAADCLRRDFVEPQLHLTPPLSRWLAQGIAKIHVPLLRSIGAIPVHHTPDKLLETYQQTVDLLAQRECILIFPEDPNQPMDPHYKMTPFKKGFTRLGELFHERTHAALAFYPLCVQPQSRTLQVGAPVRYNAANPAPIERQRIKSVLEESIHSMFLQALTQRHMIMPVPN